MQNRRTFIRNISIGTAGIMVAGGSMEALAGSKPIQLTILHTNDFHSHIDPFPADSARNANEGGMVKRAALIQKIREEQRNVLVLDAGDIFQGTPFFNFYKGELELKLMTDMGYDAATIGNHDLDNGLEGLNAQLKNAGFPFINSNYDFSGTVLEGKIPTYKVFKKQGIKIGVYGLGIELEGLVSKQNYGKTQYLDPLATALKMEKFLKEEKKTDLIICLSHLGYSYKEKKVSDLNIAAKTWHTDLIIGGHTHTFLKTPDRVKNLSGTEVLVNQVGFGGLQLGRIDFFFEKNNRKQVGKGENLPIKP
ncbi:MAG: metallophosphatase [Marinilabiliales bacterium]|nr:metallophosphatase [Marinilabiliales bacterium]